MFNSPATSSKRPHTASASSPSVTSPARKKAKTEEAANTTAIGVTTFKKLVEKSTIFIDKSLLVKDFLENPAEVLLITCPRRWGKSINMDMIKTFLEIEVDRDGNRHSDKKQASNYKLFQGEINSSNTKKENLEKPLNIVADQDFINKYQGEHPVISIDFKNIKGTNYQ